MIRDRRSLVARVIGGEVAWSPEIACQFKMELGVLFKIQNASIPEMGARLFLLKANLPHGEYEKTVEQVCPGISLATVRRWVAAFRRLAELPPVYKRKSLPPPEEDLAFDDPEFDKHLANPNVAVKTYGELCQELENLKRQKTKGAEQLEAERKKVEEQAAEIERLKVGDFIPPEVKDAAARVLHIRSRFGGFLAFWHQNLPQDLDALRLHFELLDSLTTVLAEQRERMLLPHTEKLEEALPPEQRTVDHAQARGGGGDGQGRAGPPARPHRK
jgi:hypothetical protein